MELLVVVAIIGILASLLLPALNGSKLSAHKIKCVNSLRQLALATHLYWDDNGGQCFRYSGAATNGGQVYWFGWLGPGAEEQRAFDLSLGVLYPYIRARGIEICPSLNYALAQFKLKATGASYGYGYNRFLAGTNREPPLMVGQIHRPADTVVLADAEVIEHRFRTQKARRKAQRGDAGLSQLHGHPVRQA